MDICSVIVESREVKKFTSKRSTILSSCHLIMSKNCSFVGFGRSSCGESRGVEEVVILGDCQANIESHLSSCHLSKTKLKESELIAARAGVFNPTEEQLQSMTVCRSHRNALGRFWRGARSCQYPLHSARSSKCSGRDVFNLALAKTV